MKYFKLILLVVVTTTFVTNSFGQHRRVVIKNGFSIGGGITQFNILTDNFETTQSNGWIINASATAEVPHKWYDVSYSIQLSDNNLEVAGLFFDEDVFVERQIEYNLMAAQLSFLMHAKVVKNVFSIDFGTMLQYNSKLELQSNNPENLAVRINETAIAAEAITNISQFNVNGVVGATLGFKYIKFRAQYIYGFTNILGKLNKEDIISEDFKGNQSMIALMALINF